MNRYKETDMEIKITRRGAEKLSSEPEKKFQMKFNLLVRFFGKNVRARTFQQHLALEYLDR